MYAHDDQHVFMEHRVITEVHRAVKHIDASIGTNEHGSAQLGTVYLRGFLPANSADSIIIT